ncbi:MAG: K(+)-transporting ATPase subunit C [Bacteriovorax sp.]|nr:K(+)-transporting ATPase subunit C [Bacteriovorax sp.]
MKIFVNNFKIFIFFVFLTGIIYPVFITLTSQLLFNHEANGSLLIKNGKIIGSELIAQEFHQKQYFWPRPSAANYDSSASAASNLSPDSKLLHDTIAKRAIDNNLDIQTNDDLLYASGSGLDPHISPDSANRQLMRIIEARHLNEFQITKLKNAIIANTETRQFGILGKARLNVLKLNLLLDEQF